MGRTKMIAGAVAAAVWGAFSASVGANPGNISELASSVVNVTNVGAASSHIITNLYPSGPDINNDGYVDGDDFAILINNYLTSTTLGSSAGDINGDGLVDSADFGILIDNFHTGPNPHAGLEPSPSTQTLAVSVPEPSMLVLFSIHSFLMLRRRRP